MIARTIFAGSGGQGVLTMGNILGNAAMLEDLYVTFLPAYGAAMRGGTANCTICISDEEIASPIVTSPDSILVMNQPSVFSFIERVDTNGKFIYNSSIVDTVPDRDDIQVFSVPASKIAQEMGNPRSVNMIMLGAFVKMTEVVKLETLHKSLGMLMGKKKKLLAATIEATALGYNRFPFDS